MYDCPYRARFKAQFKVSNSSIHILKGKRGLILGFPFPASFLYFLLPDLHFFEFSKGRCPSLMSDCPFRAGIQQQYERYYNF